ncbi:YeiH family protein [Cupriavidus sp. BIS7]|uniref:YeiH family protein n=1 Tax=Cupriavidus sp. BIS7 TaxID=1217718 RepID=UPI00047464A1|nr:YeiH family protein [Cupriavidus sp. BIS7]
MPETVRDSGQRPTLRSTLPGILLVVAIALPATLLGKLVPLLGGAVMGMLLGLLCRALIKPGVQYKQGIQFASKQLLQYSIVGLGFSLPLHEVVRTGLTSLPISLVTLAVAFVVAVVVGRLLRIPEKLKILIGAGTAICGGSAIAAISPVLQPDDHDMTYALSTIFMFNVVAVIIFPILGKLFGMSDVGFGMWAGTAINDTSSVVAAGYAWSSAAGEYATIVKLTRAMMIIPVTLVIALVCQRNQPGGSMRRVIPWFIVLFVLASAVNEWLPSGLTNAIRMLAPFLVVGALTGIGLSTDIGRLRRAGARPLLLGLIVWVSVAVSSLVMQHVAGLV